MIHMLQQHQSNIRRVPIPPTFNYLGMASPRLISCLVDSLTAMPKRLQQGGNNTKENTLMHQGVSALIENS